MNHFIYEAALQAKDGELPLETRPGFCLRDDRLIVEHGMNWKAGTFYLYAPPIYTQANRLNDPLNPWAVSVEQGMRAKGWATKTFSAGCLVFSSDPSTLPWGHTGVGVIGRTDGKPYVLENSTYARGQHLWGAVQLTPLSQFDHITSFIEIPERLARPLYKAGVSSPPRVPITGAMLRLIAASSVPQTTLNWYATVLDKAALEFGITTRNRVLMWVANMGEECWWFSRMVELGTGDEYEGNRNLGNVIKGDGRLFKGRGFMQLTGRWNMEHFGRAIGVNLIAQPDKAAQPDIAARVAGAYWSERHGNYYADRGNFIAAVKAVNGGLMGLEERTRALRTLSAHY